MKYYLRKIDLDMGKLEYDMYQEIPKEEMGSENEANGIAYEQFEAFLKERISEETAELNDESTPRIVYIMYVDDYPVGEIAIRPKLNQYWLEHSGNIGYKIRPTERKKGYGKLMLRLALEKCRELGINEPLLQCNSKNIASQKTIESNNGTIIKKDDSTNYYKINLSKNISINCGELEIRVDRRTELLGIIQIISDYKKTYPHLLKKLGNKKYVEEIEQKFSMYKDHKVIKLFNEIVANNNFGYDAPVHLFLQINDDFTFTTLEDYPFKTRLNSDPKVLELLRLLPSFAQEIGFEKFYNGNNDRYLKYVNNIKKNLGEVDIIASLNDYYNIPNQNKFVVNLIPWQTGGNYGTRNETEIHSNICVAYNSTNDENAYSDDKEKTYYGSLLHHEFSHSFINPLTDKYAIIKEDDPIFSDIADIMKEQAYSNNATIINEHIIRALTIRWGYLRNRKDDLYNRRTEREKERGFIYIENILNSLIFYEENRDEYPNLDSYYPIIIENIIKEYQNKSAKKI